MYSFAVIHESRNLKQARFQNQYVDLLRRTLATPSWDVCIDANNQSQICQGGILILRCSEKYLKSSKKVRKKYFRGKVLCKIPKLADSGIFQDTLVNKKNTQPRLAHDIFFSLITSLSFLTKSWMDLLMSLKRSSDSFSRSLICSSIFPAST